MGEYILSLVVIHNAFEFLSMSDTVKNVLVLSGSCNEETLTEFTLSGYTDLETIVIGDDCFQNVAQFHIGHINSLRSLVVGNNSFANANSTVDKSFSIVDCSQLRTIDISTFSFTEFTSMRLQSRFFISIQVRSSPSGNRYDRRLG